MQQLIADNEIDLAATRALLLQACRELDDGERGPARRPRSRRPSRPRRCTASPTGRCRCAVGSGSRGDLPVAKIAREVRPFRIYDGPSEVHRWSIAKRAVRAITGGRPVTSPSTRVRSLADRARAAWSRGGPDRGRPWACPVH